MADRGKIWDILNFFAGDAGSAVDAAKNSDTDEEYLAQRRARGLSDAAFGMFDVPAQVANAAIGDVDYWTSGGLSGGTYDPYQFPMASQSAANLATEATGTDVIPPERVSPAVQQKGANQQALFGMIPAGVDDLIPGIAMASALVPASKALSKADDLVPAVKAAQKGIRAYHGTPHDFEKFDLSKIGTGEGAQAYGHGLYFAENEGVAEGYKKRLAGEPKVGDESIFTDMPWMSKGSKGMARGALQSSLAKGLTGDDAVRDAAASLTHMGDMQDASHVRQPYYDAANGIQSLAGKKWSTDSGHMYEVNINADPDAFLDWDKPYLEQSEAVRRGLDEAGFAPPPGGELMPGSELYNRALQNDPGEWGSSKQYAAGAMKELGGIPGIKYLDAGSRTPKTLFDGQPIQSGAKGPLAAQQAAESLDLYGTPEAAIEALSRNPGYQGANIEAAELLRSGRVKRTMPEGSRNYVVFDDKIIEVVKKNGVAAALAAGLITESEAEELYAQGHT